MRCLLQAGTKTQSSGNYYGNISMTIILDMSVVLSFFKHITSETGSVFTNMWDETNVLYSLRSARKPTQIPTADPS